MKFLGDPQDRLKVIHIAGTSGKTSTAYYVSVLLDAAGLKTGLSVSPHVDEINERLQLDTKPVGETEFCQAMTDFLTEIEPAPVEPSRFEVMAAFAYWYFAKQGLDYAVIEVGLGGLKDGTNIVSRPDKICVITDIGLDHTHILGETSPEIASQKIGIVQPGNVVFTHPQPDEVMAVYRNYCEVQKAELNIVEPPDSEDYRDRNWNLAHRVYEYLMKRDGLPGLSAEDLEKTKQTVIPGRLDTRKIDDKILIMDGAHNPQKMHALVSSLKKLYPGQKVVVMVSLKEGKDAAAIVDEIVPIAARAVVTIFDNEQDMPNISMAPQDLAGIFKDRGITAEIITGHEEAINKLLAGEEKTCLITGSFYLLGQIRNSKILE